MVWNAFFDANAIDAVLMPISPTLPFLRNELIGADAYTPERKVWVNDSSAHPPEQRCYADYFYWPHFSILAQLPSVSIPCGLLEVPQLQSPCEAFTPASCLEHSASKVGEPRLCKVPVGFQLVGRPHADAQLVDMAAEMHRILGALGAMDAEGDVKPWHKAACLARAEVITLHFGVMTSTVTSIVPSGAGASGRLHDTGKFSTARVPACRLRLPQFEWYLGPMYRRYAEIMAERERANTAGFVKKKVTPTVPDEPTYIKHITTRTPVFAFNDAVLDRPLTNMGQAYYRLNQKRDKEKADEGAWLEEWPRDKDKEKGVAR